MRKINVRVIILMLILLIGSSDLLAQTRIRFARGKSSAVVSNAVIRGDVDTYLVGAKARQKMTVKITSVERNAVFSIEKPGGGYLDNAGEDDDQTVWRGTLPESGDYKITVAGTRGNATYRLTVTIK